jgi:hypothetical protein
MFFKTGRKKKNQNYFIHMFNFVLTIISVDKILHKSWTLFIHSSHKVYASGKFISICRFHLQNYSMVFNETGILGV